jgi:hypothetical protein
LRCRKKESNLPFQGYRKEAPVSDDQKMDPRLLPQKMSLQTFELGLQVVSKNLIFDTEEQAYLAIDERELPPQLQNLPEQAWAYLCQAHERLMWEQEHSPVH